MKTFIAIAAVAACLAGAALADPVPFKSCAPSDPVSVKSIDVSGTLSPGQSVTVNATGSSSVAITGGAFKLAIKFLGITVLTQTGDLCSSKEFSIHCPVAAGAALTAGGDIAIPSAAPAGAYVLELTGADPSGTQLFCVDINVNIKASDFDEEAPALHPDIIATVNKANAGWTAGHNPYFEGRQLKHVAKLCGTVTSGPTAERSRLPLKSTEDMLPASAIPASFDARTAWPKCPIIGHVRDQADCGSCWAFGSTEAFNDRMCIASNGTFQTELSAGDTTACCSLFQATCMSMGCSGGQPSGAWSYFVSHGVVSGGDYSEMNTGKSCFPYPIPNCGHHEPSPFKNCTNPEASTPTCPNPKACPDSKYGGKWATDTHKAKTSYSIGSVQQAQSDIMTYGSITGAFTVYADFPTYRSGVYKHVTGSALGGHAIKVLGWGTENGQDYWLVANSWNKYWGDGGFFKIARGTDECGIEDGLCAGHV